MSIVYRTVKSAINDYARFGIIELNRPQQRNALSKDLLTRLNAQLDSCHSDDSLRALIVTTSSNTFCAGADLKERKSMSISEVSTFLDSLRTTFTKLATFRTPTISIIHGHALGGGLELALSTDFRILDKSALVGLPETKLGIIPGAGGTQRLSRLIGPTRTKQVIFTARPMNAIEADKLGIGRLAEQPMMAAIELCEAMVSQSPGAITQAKQVIDESLEQGLDRERAGYNECLKHPDRDEGLLAFSEKRPPIYGRPKL